MADDEIHLIPEVPATLREAAQMGKLIPFVGAGASCVAGCPNWSEFADGALKYLIGAGKFSYAQLAQLDGLTPRVKLSLALSLQKEYNVKIDFKSLLHPSNWKNSAPGRRIYLALSRIGKTFVTTNYDEWLDEEIAVTAPSVRDTAGAPANSSASPRTIFYKPQELTASNLNIPNAVFHLHGSLKDPDGMILTTRDYLAHYANDRRMKSTEQENLVLTFLEDLFANKNVLFVGYGLQELEVLEYILLKTHRPAFADVQPKHFLLEGYFSHQRELMLGMKRYYREVGIELLPFLTDEKGRGQLLEVLDDFAVRLPASQLTVLAELNEMEALLND